MSATAGVGGCPGLQRSLRKARVSLLGTTSLALALCNLVVVVDWADAQNPAASDCLPPLPVVVSATLPSYPLPARVALLQGTVKLRVSTNGRTVSRVADVSGSPILLAEAAANIRSWVFKPHKPTTFPVTFSYVLEAPGVEVRDPECIEDNPTLFLRLPSEVRITAGRRLLMTVDPRSGGR